MARIRTIKPEFPQSESMGNVSRDARLCFVMMWTLADDSGRLRGNSRMLASLLFPYDDDASDLIEVWLDELSAEGCIDRYLVGGSSYIQIANWLSHQKIDKPSASKIPPFDEASRIVAKPRELSCEDQGPKDQGPGSSIAPNGARQQPTASDTPACPYEQIVSLYHDKLAELPGVRVMDDKRKRKIKSFWVWVLTSKRSDGQRRANGADQALTWIGQYFERASANDFVMGRSGRNGDHRHWRADIEYLCGEAGRKQVIEKTVDHA
jgi:hypothetical protein